MKKELEPIDTENCVYILPTDKEIADVLGIDATCHHGYTTYQACPACLEAILSECFAEVEHLKSKRRRK